MMYISTQTEREIAENISAFKRGNRSAWCLSRGRFFKLWLDKAPAHNLLLSPYYKALQEIGLVACLEEYGKLRRPLVFQGKQYTYAYVFSSLTAKPASKNLKEVLHALTQGEYWWINNLYFFFTQIQLAGFAYFDIDWSNLGISKTPRKRLVFYDVDSACLLSERWNQIQQYGNNSFSILFNILRKDYNEDTLKLFNVAALEELYTATVFAYVANDHSILQRNRYRPYFEKRPRVPNGLSLSGQRRTIVEMFLIQTIGICREAFSGDIEPKCALKKLNQCALDTFKKL